MDKRPDHNRKTLRMRNLTGKPDNIVLKENRIFLECRTIEQALPKFINFYFYYLKGNVLPLTRLAYLRDLQFFCRYLVEQSGLTAATRPADLTPADFEKIQGRDINLFLEYCRRYEVVSERQITIYTNDNRSLARKRSSLSVFFKFLYREELVTHNITDKFDPIRVPKPGEKEIKALQDDEVMVMLDAVASGEHLTEREKTFWKKTRYRDRAILLLFLTYGLRLSELQQLNLSSFHFGRGEFIIYRKRGKESTMPLNHTILHALRDYLDLERPADDRILEPDQDALFLSLQGRRLTERQIRELVKKYSSIALTTSRRAGYSPHKLRATAATSLIGRGNSIYDVQALLDHENVTTTQLYAAHKLNVKRDLIKRFEWDEAEKAAATTKLSPKKRPISKPQKP